MASGRTSEHSGLAVEMLCRVCGRPIVLVAGEDGTEIADRVQFLAEHRSCLLVSVPEQRSSGSR